MAPLPSSPSLFLRYRRCLLLSVFEEDSLSIAFNASLLRCFSIYHLRVRRKLQELAVSAFSPAKQRTLLVSELYRITASLIKHVNSLVVRRISLVCGTRDCSCIRSVGEI